MNNHRTVRAVIAVAAAALAVGGYFLIVPDTNINPNLVARLVFSSTGLSGEASAPTYSNALPTTSSPLSSLTAAAEQQPGLTGSYARNWFGSVAVGNSVNLSVDLLPTRAIALATQNEAGTQDLGAAALKTGLHTATSRFIVPGGAAVLYTTARPVPKSGPAGPPVPGAAADFSFGRVVARLTTAGPISTRSNIDALVSRESNLLKRVLPKFPPLSFTTYPATKSIVYGIVALVLIVLLALVPDWTRRVRAQRHARELARQRRQFQVRGSKALKRHRVRI